MEGLLAVLAESPDDLASWSVYADFLQAQSDPRGELISTMLERAQRPSPRLYDAQRRYLLRHATRLVPPGLAPDRQVWRNGFVAELRVEMPEQLALLADPALRFADTVTLAIDGETWLPWCEALAGRRWPWRRLTVELANPPADVEVRRLLACAPAVEHLRIQVPEDDATTLVWDDVVAPALRRLVMLNAGPVDAFARTELPALRELWLLGASVATPALRAQWHVLDRLVVEGFDDDDDSGNVVRFHPHAEHVDDYYEDVVPSNAFVLVGQRIERALVEKLAARMTGLAQLSVRIADLWWQHRPVTVLQLYGTRDPDAMLPYSLAVALEHVLAAPPPIVLVELGDERAQFLALGTPEARGALSAADAEPGDVVRRAFDLAFGRDPGRAIVDDVREALAAAPEHVLVGSVAGDRILNVIDPRATPIDAVEDADYGDDDEDEDEDDYDDQPWEDDLERYEEPVPIARLVVKTDEDVWIQQQQADEAEELGEPVADEEDEPSAAELVEHPEAWFEFREHWDDRAGDPDDEPGEVRWPDPAASDTEVLDLDRQIAPPACLEHDAPFETCSWCSARICLACNDTAPLEPIEGVCTTCLATLDQQPAPRERVVS